MASSGLVPHHVLRAMKNDPKVGNGIMDQVSAVMEPAIPVSKKHNATYGMVHFRRIMLASCVLGISAFGYAASIRRIVTSRRDLDRNHRMHPYGEWIRNVIAQTDASRLTDSFTQEIAEQVDILRKMGVISGKMDVAIDMHLIPRWDGEKTEDLARSKMKDGTTYFERYITVQCVNDDSQITIAAMRMPALEDTAKFVSA